MSTNECVCVCVCVHVLMGTIACNISRKSVQIGLNYKDYFSLFCESTCTGFGSAASASNDWNIGTNKTTKHHQQIEKPFLID